MKKMNLLSKAEMKKIVGGSGTHLFCTTPGGSEDWSRPHCNPSTADAACRAIYPAYAPETVSGSCGIVIPI